MSSGCSVTQSPGSLTYPDLNRPYDTKPLSSYWFGVYCRLPWLPAIVNLLRGSGECPGQYSRNLVSLLHLYFSYINGTELTNQLLGRLNIVRF